MPHVPLDIQAGVERGERLEREALEHLLTQVSLNELTDLAARSRDLGHGDIFTYSRKVFIPLTELCRDVCHYCTFAKTPRRIDSAFMSLESVLDVAKRGAEAGCQEALFTLGDKPELRYKAARSALEAMGHDSTLSYLAEAAELVFKETGLLPHLNPGVMSETELLDLRKVSVSQGIMLESSSPRLTQKGMAHYGSPDKHPAVRLETLRLAGKANVPFTTGILIGIGETPSERLDTLCAIRDVADQGGHIQEVIIQNFRAKPGTKMAHAPEPSLEDLLWTIACARLLFGPHMSIQAPPNLSPGQLSPLMNAGLNDWGGVSPVTPDHVNPEAPWPHLDRLVEETRVCGKALTQRLALYPSYAVSASRWVDPSLLTGVIRAMDGAGFARGERWTPGSGLAVPQLLIRHRTETCSSKSLEPILDKAAAGIELSARQVAALFNARGDALSAVCERADQLRSESVGDVVTYAVNRNINYTNVCYFKCGFCAFSKGKRQEHLRGAPYDLDLSEIVRRVEEAWARGATEVCMQGGIHPDYTGETYLKICEAIKTARPQMHIHAFSPLEVWQGAKTLGVSVKEFLSSLKAAGLSTLPGTAAEILDEEVRRIICPDKITTAEWLSVMEAAHERGLRTTSTIMFGHVDSYVNWARHLLRLRALQMRTGGFTEFVPLPFVPMEAPMYLRGRARRGPSFRETVLMHAVGRLVLHPYIRNIQTSWVKLGADGVTACLQSGANDVGGTLMNESITRAAGGRHGQEMGPVALESLIQSLGRKPQQRTTLYEAASNNRHLAALYAPDLAPIVNQPIKRRDTSRKSALHRSGVTADH